MQWLRFLIVGGSIGVSATVLIGWIDRHFQPTPFVFGIAVAFIYFTATFISFFAHQKITFQVKQGSYSNGFARYLMLTIVMAIISAFVTTVAKSMFELSVYPEIRQASAWLSFLVANLVLAMLSYRVNQKFIFK
jgi:putative flippase GtrA